MDMQPDPKIFLKFAHAALVVLTARTLTWAAMLITAAMFAYALYSPSELRLGGAVLFALLVFWRVTWIERITAPPKGESDG